MFMHKRLNILLLVLLGMSASLSHAELRIITLQHRMAQDILPAIQPMVGRDGSVSELNNTLLVRGTPDELSMIEQAVAALDVERRNLRITISHESSQQIQTESYGLSGRVGRAGIRAESPASRSNRDIQLNLDKNTSNKGSRGSEFVTVLDGERAFIRVGQSVPFSAQWSQYMQRYSPRAANVEFRDITTGFAVRPRTIGNQVELEITPRIARLNSSQFIDFEELSTFVRVPSGQWFDLGGAMQSRDEVSITILGYRSQSGSDRSQLLIKVE